MQWGLPEGSRIGTNADFIEFLLRAGVTHFKYYYGISLRKTAKH